MIQYTITISSEKEGEPDYTFPLFSSRSEAMDKFDYWTGNARSPGSMVYGTTVTLRYGERMLRKESHLRIRDIPARAAFHFLGRPDKRYISNGNGWYDLPSGGCGGPWCHPDYPVGWAETS